MSDRVNVARALTAPPAGASRAQRAPARARVDWQRVVTWSALILVVVFAAFTFVLTLRGTQYGFDFRGIWRAGGRLLAGQPIYPASTVFALEAQGNALIAPPFMALLAAPLSLLPFTLAMAVWNLACMSALLGALALSGVRDRRVLVLAACSFPAISALMLGQPDGLIVLAAASAWRQRGHPVGATSVGVLIAAKLLAWPLVIWLLVTRRWRSAAIAVTTAALLLLGSWSLIGFSGLGGYLHLLSADATAYAVRSYSLAGLALRLGASSDTAEALMLVAAVAVSGAIVVRGRFTDAAWFSAALLFGLLCSPILWSHYLLLLTVVIAMRHRRLHPLWLIFATVFWISPMETASAGQVAAVLGCAAALVAAAVAPARHRRLGAHGPAVTARA